MDDPRKGQQGGGGKTQGKAETQDERFLESEPA
jgi:hypothetical protein